MSIWTWDMLSRELDRWGDAGHIADFWWRDDDAVRTGPKLDRLLDIARGQPIAIAVIPADAQPDLADFAAEHDALSILVHGYAHENHEPPGVKKSEFGASRERGDRRRDAEAGLTWLKRLFGTRLTPIFVPPWNRIDPGFASRLPTIGFRAWSGFGSRTRAEAAFRINTHIDPIDWHGTRGFLGESTVLRTIGETLSRRRAGLSPREPNAETADASAPDPMEPTGILTHHIEHDAALWDFLNRLSCFLNDHPAGRIVSVEEGLAERPAEGADTL